MMTDLGGGLLAASACLVYLLFLDPDQIPMLNRRTASSRGIRGSTRTPTE